MGCNGCFAERHISARTDTLCIRSYALPLAGEPVKQGFLKRNPMLNRGGAFYPPTQSSAVFR
ncbi:MAG: hypothetical protein EAY65_00670 [Alphaproteobacteria bacterium]|nr:MAG: hypothetical protein EAY65_00670 [Alphaproteobacteria bacterium]